MKPCVNWEIRTRKMTGDDLKKPDQTVTIQTPCGEIKGLQYSGYKLFRGIRYANAERWEPAVPVTAWDGVYDATAWGPRPMQFKAYFGRPNTATNAFYSLESLFEENAGNYSEEGSLNLNIWTPDNAENCPVLFYIHGGAFMNGSGTDPWIDGEEYAKHGVILVSINYRLGPWYQVAGDGSKGNFCLTDQITAIEWVKRNIKAYGGDPDRIVIAGESAGAMSVQCILFSPVLKEGTVSGGIIMSDGGSFFHKGTSDKVEQHWKKVKEKMGVKTLQELKDVPAVDVYRGRIAAGMLDMDHVGAKLRQESRGHRGGEHGAEVHDLNVAQNFLCHRGIILSSRIQLLLHCANACLSSVRPSKRLKSAWRVIYERPSARSRSAPTRCNAWTGGRFWTPGSTGSRPARCGRRPPPDRGRPGSRPAGATHI